MSDHIDPQRAVDELIRRAPQYAKAKAERVYVEEYRKTLKAILMRESEAKTAIDREAEAYASQRYIDHLEALREAVEAEETHRWTMIAAQARIDVWRSQNAANRNLERATT
jgi:hypothetical protein